MTNLLSAMFGSQMSVASLRFIVFTAVVTLVYYLVPKKGQWIVLALANTVFYICGGFEMLFYLVASVAVTYATGMLQRSYFLKQKLESQGLERSERKPIKEKYAKKRKKVLLCGVGIIIAVLAITKYTGFFLFNINRVFGLVGITIFDVNAITSHLPVILGCSYYTLSVISYMVDVYRGKYEAQTNFFKLYLFVSFYPHIIQGPIDRYDTLSPELYKHHDFSFENLKTGAMLIIWGMFKKLVIADRLAKVSTNIFSNYESFSGITVFIGAVVFSVQLYADWTAYCDIVGGSAEILGIKIAQNFNRPYFSKTLPEFWRRWHISMGTFFKDYVLYPVSTSKFCLKINKKARQKFGNTAGRIISSSIPIIAVWLLTGFWHGASWHFIFWGIYQGAFIILSLIFTPYFKKVSEKLNFKTDTFSWQLFRMFRTFAICCVGRLFFSAKSVRMLFGMLKQLFHISGFGLSELQIIGLNGKEWAVVCFSLALMLAVSVLEEKYEVRKLLDSQPILFKWPVLIFIIMFILIFGVYGSNAGYTSFVYEQF